MAYSTLLLENKSDSNKKIKSPLGFSWVILFSPIIVGVLSSLIRLVIYAILGIADVSGLEEASILAKSLTAIVVLIMFLLNTISYCLVPLIRKDPKWAVIMALSGILTLGLSIILFSFIYNKIYIIERYKEGYQVSDIMETEENTKPLLDTNPVEFNKTYGKYFIWVDWYGIKFMKYFSNIESAMNYVVYNSKKCIKIIHIAKSISSLCKIDKNLLDKYKFPYKAWAEQLS